MRSLLFILIFLLCNFLLPQYIDNNQFPPGIDWRYIDTKKFRIVFPAEITNEGQRVANLLEYIYPKIALDKDKGKRLTLFLPNCGVFSNGYIQLAPQKGEFFSTPPQSSFVGNIEWYSALSLHEGKHIDQFERLNTGFTRIGSLVFGDLGRSLLSFLSVPVWFWEGEAINTETIYSSGGRGRLPSFSMGTRSILLAGKRYKYIKSYLSSYRDHIPDIYRLGYFLTTYLKNNFTSKSIERVLKHASDYSFYPFIFSAALKKETGISLKQLYNKVMDDLYKKWEPVDRDLNLTEFKKINTKKKEGWTLYTSAKSLDKGDVITQKYGISSPLNLVKISANGEEKKITGLNTVSHINNVLSVSRNKVIWSEPVKDLRWGNRSYSEIVIYNISDNKKRRLTRRTRYFSPALSRDGNLIAAIRFSKMRKSSLAILDSTDGRKISEYNSPENSLLITPSWEQNDGRIVFIRMKNGKKSITVFNMQSENFTDILPLSYNSYSTPVFFNNFIIYSSPYSGIDNICAVDISTGKQYKITTSRFGAFFPSISKDKKRLIYSEYNLNGMDIVTAPIEQGRWIPLNEVVVDRLEYFKKEDGSFKNSDLTEKDLISTRKYRVRSYGVLRNIINFHSRVILPDRTEPAIEIYSGNKLNTAFLTAGLSFNTNENTGNFYSEAVYAGMFPVIKAGISLRGRRITDPADLKWNETTSNLSFLIPLNLSRGVFVRRLDLQARISSTKISGTENNNYKIEAGSINSISYKMMFYNYKHFSKRDIAPVTGQFFSAEYSNTPWNNYYKGEKLFMKGVLYFPGLFRHNSLRISLSYEHQDPVNYLFSSNINFSRGYDFRFIDNFIFASIDYTFPVAYPDLILGELFYLKRIKGGIFADFGKGFNEDNTEFFNSAGLEIMGDINLFSIPVDLEAGIRISYRFADNTFRIEPLFFGISF